MNSNQDCLRNPEPDASNHQMGVTKMQRSYSTAGLSVTEWSGTRVTQIRGDFLSVPEESCSLQKLEWSPPVRCRNPTFSQHQTSQIQNKNQVVELLNFHVLF